MALTYTLIASNTLGASAASVTFSSIPATYTDLVVKCSSRTNGADGSINISTTFNGSTSAIYSYVRLRGTGSAASSSLGADQTAFNQMLWSEGTVYTSNTFSNVEMYIPNYLAATNKPVGDFSVTENNATAAEMYAVAGLWRNTAAITSISMTPLSGSSFVANSSFYLYGIKKA